MPVTWDEVVDAAIAIGTALGSGRANTSDRAIRDTTAPVQPPAQPSMTPLLLGAGLLGVVLLARR